MICGIRLAILISSNREGGLLNHPATEAEFSIVKNSRLSGGNSLVRFSQSHFPTSLPETSDPAIGQSWAMPDLCLQIQPLRFAGNPVH